MKYPFLAYNTKIKSNFKSGKTKNQISTKHFQQKQKNTTMHDFIQNLKLKRD